MINFTDELLEKMAALEHERWSNWMKWQFEQGSFNFEENTWTMNSERVAKWIVLMITPYDRLSEELKEFDRIEARKTIKLIKSYEEEIEF